MAALFFILSSIILAAAAGVVLFRNPVYSAIALVTNMLGIAALFAMLDAHFLSTVQIIVYAGAVVVLFLFVIMLLNAKIEQPSSRDAVFGGMGLILAGVFLGSIVPLLSGAFDGFAVQSISADGSFTGAPVLEGTVKDLGQLLFTKYLFPFEAASMLLMAALVGAVLLGHEKKAVILPPTQTALGDKAGE